jgi:hypothetical protein
MQKILSRDLPSSTDRNVIVTYRPMLASFQRGYRAAAQAVAGMARGK